MLTYDRTGDIAIFTCDSCGHTDKVVIGSGLPQGWIAKSSQKHYCTIACKLESNDSLKTLSVKKTKAEEILSRGGKEAQVISELWPDEFKIHAEWGDLYALSGFHYMVARVGSDGYILVGVSGGYPDCACWYGAGEVVQQVYLKNEFVRHLRRFLAEHPTAKYVGKMKDYRKAMPS